MYVMFFIAALLAAVTGCGDDDDGPTGMSGDNSVSFSVSIENLSTVPEFSAGGVFDTPVGKIQAGPLPSGEAYEFTFGAAPGSRLSFSTMFVQSNDLFYGPAGAGILLFDNGGNALSGDVTDQVMLWDGGSEENEEPGVGANQAPRQSGADTGPADSNNLVRLVSDGFSYPAASDVIEVTLTHQGGNIFHIRIENISQPWTASALQDVDLLLAPGVFVVHTADNPLFTSASPDRGEGLESLAEDGSPGTLLSSLDARTGLTTPLAPGVFLVHTGDAPLFTGGQADYGEGLEALAEDGDPSGLAMSIEGASGVRSSAVFNTPAGAAGAGPLLPGETYSFTFDARPGDRLSFATMFVQSNDLFYGTGMNGFALFDGGGSPHSGDITSSIYLWDGGTEANQWPGAGPDQPLRQSGGNSGTTDTDNTVRMVNDTFDYPEVGDRIRVTITSGS